MSPLFDLDTFQAVSVAEIRKTIWQRWKAAGEGSLSAIRAGKGPWCRMGVRIPHKISGEEGQDVRIFRGKDILISTDIYFEIWLECL